MTRLVRLAAATALVAAAGLTGPAPAYAAACSTASGVSVVVDFHELGGGLQQVCDAGGGGQKASALFPDNGFPLTYVQRQPGFVCQVSGAPADESCVNTPPPDAYWGLWWSDGESGTWSYSSVGVASLTIPDGGSVALSWNGSSTKSPPGAPPPQHQSGQEPSEKPEPTRSPTQPPTSGGGTTGGGGTSSTTPTTDPSTSSPARDRRERRAGDRADEKKSGRTSRDRDRGDEAEEPTSSPTSTPTDPAVVAEPPAASDDSALPVWVGPTAVGGVLGLAGLATYLRRRASGTP